MLGSLFLAWVEHDAIADSCDEPECGVVHNDGNEDPDTDNHYSEVTKLEWLVNLI